MFWPQQPQSGARKERRMERQSAGLTDTANTFTNTSSAAGVGCSTSAIRSISGGPYFSKINAFITGAPTFRSRRPL
jgi:hypothetical protein